MCHYPPTKSLFFFDLARTIWNNVTLSSNSKPEKAIKTTFVSCYHFLPTFVLRLPDFAFLHKYLLFSTGFFSPTLTNFLTLCYFSSTEYVNFHLLTWTYATISLDAMLQVLMLCLFHLWCFVMLTYFTASHKSDMNITFKTIVMKINIIKTNFIIKIYIKKSYIATKNVTLLESALYHN